MNQATKQRIKKRWPITVSIGKYVRNSYKEQLSRRYIKSLLRQQKEIFIEVGAGNVRKGPEWTTIDMSNHCDIFWDLSKGIPFPENSVTKIYSSHFLEHLTFKEGQVFLKSCLKALVPGGTFSICVPNAKLFIDAYIGLLDENILSAYRSELDQTTKIDYINIIAYMEGTHKYMFDQENLITILKKIGFAKVAPRKFDPSLDLKERDLESIYAVATK